MSDMQAEESTCLNCGTPLQGPFCYQCGQKDLPARQTLGDLLNNFVGSFTSFESKFFRSLRHLLFSPGKLTLAYIGGKREMYYHPARMYVFLSFIYFLLFFWLYVASTEEVSTYADSIPDELPGLSMFGKTYNPPFKTEAAYDSVQLTLDPSQRDGTWDRMMNERAIRFNKLYASDKVEAVAMLSRVYLESAPKIIFILLPIFAWLLKGLYLRRNFYYSEHLVFSVHFYNFCFVVGTVGILLSEIPGIEWLPSLLFLWVFVYLFIAMRRVYGQKAWKTGLKYLLLCLSFMVVILTAITANAVVLIFLI